MVRLDMAFYLTDQIAWTRRVISGLSGMLDTSTVLISFSPHAKFRKLAFPPRESSIEAG